MPSSDRPPEKAPGTRVCPGCGWANAAQAVACEFCKIPFDRVRAPAAVSHRSVPAGKVESAASGIVKNVFGSPRAIIFAVIVASGLFSFSFFFRAQRRATTAEHVREMKKRLEIYEGENGGYPSSLETTERRYGPIAPFFRKDGWDREIRYTAARPLEGLSESGERGFLECELRSAGGNGEFGDEDDIVWKGNAGR